MNDFPPSQRSNAALGLTAHAAQGRFALQVCNKCMTVQYPPREACVACLSDELTWREQDGDGELIAATAVFHSTHPYFRTHEPWHIGIVRLDAGVSVIAHLHKECANSRGRVRVRAVLDRGGQGVLVALPQSELAVPQDFESPGWLERVCVGK